MAGEDFVFVQMTEAGAKVAGAHKLHVAIGRRHWEFLPGASGQPHPAIRVERSFEWNAVLSKQVTPEGKPFFEVVAAAAPPTLSSAATIEESHQ